MAVCACNPYRAPQVRELIRKVLGVSLALALAACQQHHVAQPSYRGYKMAPYTLKGLRFVPMNVEQALRYDAVGIASHYEANGAQGAIGERLYRDQYYAAHRTLPLPCTAQITNLQNGLSCVVRVADRGPYIAGRLIDVSSAVAHKLRFHHNGLARVHVKVLSVGDGAYMRSRTR